MLITNPEHKLFTLLVSSSTCSAPVPSIIAIVLLNLKLELLLALCTKLKDIWT